MSKRIVGSRVSGVANKLWRGDDINDCLFLFVSSPAARETDSQSVGRSERVFVRPHSFTWTSDTVLLHLLLFVPAVRAAPDWPIHLCRPVWLAPFVNKIFEL